MPLNEVKTTPEISQKTDRALRVRGTSAVTLGRLNRLAGNSLVHSAILIAIIVYCFARTLGSYFLADDFGEICYVTRIFHGEPNLFWSNFTGNYMQIPSMSVYRPMLLTTLVLDYLTWKTDAFGYYLTNILYFTGDCFMLYLLTKSLTSSWSSVRSKTIALLAAALFASYPLHSESISWVVGRVDIACCFYYLSSLYLLVRSRNSASGFWLVASLTSFWLGLLTKEMAIGLPLVASAAGFFLFSQVPAGSTSLKLSDRLKTALASSWPFWLSTVFYFAIRFCALGTFTGGYTGGIGHSQLSSLLEKWTDFDTLRRLNFPLNYSVFHDSGIYPKLLSVLYTVLGCTLGVRLIGRAMPWNWVFFGVVWLASAAAPVYQLWGLGYNLEGSRFFFFLSVPLCVLTAVIALAPAPKGDFGPKLKGRLTLVNAFALAVLVLLFARISYLNNIPWVQAGKTVNKVRRQAEQLAKTCGQNEKLIVLGIPKENGGAHMILNGATFAMMMNKPFVGDNHALSFLTFDPVLFGNADLINSQRLKKSVGNGVSVRTYCWDSKTDSFRSIVFGGDWHRPNDSPDFTKAQVPSWQPNWTACTASGTRYSITGNGVSIDAPVDGDGLELSGLNLNPLSADFVELTVTYPRTKRQASVSVSWRGADTDGSSEPVVIEQQAAHTPVSILIPVSRYWRWYAAGTVKALNVHLNGFESIEVSGVRLLASNDVAPQLSIKDDTYSPRGVFESPSLTVNLEFDASRISDAASIEFEISRPNFFFEQTTQSGVNEAILNRVRNTATRGLQSLSTVNFPERAYYQVRARALNKTGQPIGAFSDPITIDRQKGR
jgi:hypothetical protein